MIHKPKSGKNEGDDDSSWRQASLALSIPTTLLAGPLVGFLIALGLKKWLDWDEEFARKATAVCILLGLVAGARETIRLIKKISS